MSTTIKTLTRRFKNSRADDPIMPGLYKKSTHDKYSKIVKFTSVQDAKESVALLEKEYRSATTSSKRLLIRQVTNYASNRAKGNTKQKNISAMTRQRFSQISKIYRDLFIKLKNLDSACR